MKLIKDLLDRNNLDFVTENRIICHRLKFENKDTFLGFLNLKKAYDSVLIYNVLMKIYYLGIRDVVLLKTFT